MVVLDAWMDDSDILFGVVLVVIFMVLVPSFMVVLFHYGGLIRELHCMVEEAP
jgi:hypothetical protein